MNRGYIKLWRKTLDSGLLSNGPVWQVFGYLMLNATHKPHKMLLGSTVIDLRPGDVVVSRRKMAEKLNLGEQQIRTALKTLEKLEIVTSRITHRYTLISLTNWDTYQDEQPTANPQPNPQPNPQITHSQPSANPVLTQEQERKKEIIYIPPHNPPRGGDGVAEQQPAVEQPTAEQPTSEKRKAKTARPYSAEFENFWAAYPNKVGKDAAWRAWQKRKADLPEGEELLAILARQRASQQWQKDGGQYVPHPATWLNQGRWQDVLETPQTDRWAGAI